jgi:hypothetical protein
MINHDDLLPLAGEIARLMQLDSAERHERERGARHRSAEGRRVSADLIALREEARSAFAAARGWKRTRCEFHTDGLVHGLRHSPRYTMLNSERDARDIGCALGRPWIDHAEFYRTPGRSGVCAGIVSHAYLRDHGGIEAPVAYAERAGLVCEVFPPVFSWYYPGATTLLVFSRPAADGLAQLRRLAAHPRRVVRKVREGA